MPKKIFTEQEKQEIIREYTINKIGAKTLGEKYGCSAPTLLKNLKEWGIQPNSKKLNLTNKIFGELTVLKPATAKEDKYTRWICKCSCGKEVEVRTDYLTSGHTTSCGHIKNQLFGKKDLIGQRFGKLTVIENIPPESKKCQCDCGNICFVKTYNLTNGNTQSCGCLKSKGELKLNNLLTELGIDYKTQYTFEDCRFPQTGKLAYFDYAIFKNDKLNLLIEYDGLQHFVGWNYDKNSLSHIQEYDKFKEEYCQKNNIPLIRIPYTDLNKINKEYLLNLLNIEEAQEGEV